MPNPQKLQFEREDWTLFRSVETLPQKAGVPAPHLRRLVLKELADNALDAGAEVEIGESEDGGYYVQDDGPGISDEPQEIARLFSINRPLVSSKLLRLPTRGAVGNGLRVVAGTVLASQGRLVIWNRDQRLILAPKRDGTTAVEAEPADFPTGTRVEIRFGDALPNDPHAMRWADLAASVGHSGKTYKGKSSPYWYGHDAFHELLHAAGDRPVRDLIAELDGCSGAKAGLIAADFKHRVCNSVTKDESYQLLMVALGHARPVNPNRLGRIGPTVMLEPHHAAETGIFSRDGAQIPYIVEVFIKAVIE